jgi:hypothetical protein
MSQRNGDRARFHKDRKRKLRHRQRIEALKQSLLSRAGDRDATRVATLTMQGEGGPVRAGD